MDSVQTVLNGLTVVSTVAIALIPIEPAQAAAVFTDPSRFDRSTVIDFEPGGSGNTIADINTSLTTLATGATLTIGGAGARIDDLSDSERAPLFGVSPGADGGPTSGVWGFEGGVRGESFLTLTFAPGHFVDAVGSFWGGVEGNPTHARAVATFEDGSTFTAILSDFLPPVSDSAPDSAGINGFLGIDGAGQQIQQVSFFNNNDLYSQDDVTFGFIDAAPPDPESVPEPASTLAMTIFGLVAIAATPRRRKTG